MTQGYYNPQVNYWQNQMRNLANGYGYPMNNYPQQTSQSLNQLPCRQVGSYDEAKSAILENLSIPYVFTNFPNNEIYVKYTENSTGQAKTVIFVPKEEEVKEVQKENNLLEKKIKELEEEIKILNNEIILIKGGLNNVSNTNEPDTDIAKNSKSDGRNAKDIRK